MSDTTLRFPVIVPMTTNRPRLRFLEGAPEGAAGDPPADDPAAESTPAEQAPEPGADALGDPGKKALDAMKQKWKDAERTARETSAELARLKAEAAGKQVEHEAEVAAQKAKDDALAAANERILKAEVRAAAAGKLSDPADALRFIDLSSIEVGEDGEVNAADIASAIDDLINTKPYLAAQGGRFQGSGDGGARNGNTQKPQLTEADLGRMSPEQIVDARKNGQLNKLLGITT